MFPSLLIEGVRLESCRLFLAVPGFVLFFHLMWSFVQMREFAWHWPKNGYRPLETEASADDARTGSLVQ